MNDWITLLKPDRVTDRMGAETTTYAKTRTVHAEYVEARGNRSEEVGEHFPDYTVKFNIRIAHPVQENWRAQHLGGYLYTVVAIIRNRNKDYKTLLCERVNE